jgi:hypothetical protein
MFLIPEQVLPNATAMSISYSGMAVAVVLVDGGNYLRIMFSLLSQTSAWGYCNPTM